MQIHHISSLENIVYHTPDIQNFSTQFIIQEQSSVSIVIVFAKEQIMPIAQEYQFVVGAASQVKLFFAFLRGDDVKVSCTIDIQGQQSYVNLYSVYALSEDQKLQFITQQMHHAQQSSSVVLMQGIVSGFAHCEYKGLIYVDQKAAHTYADQQHQNLILSDTSKVQTDPHIQVYTNEVMCSHGAASSGFDEEQMYSLQTRGIEKKQAEKLLLEAFLQNVLMYFPESETIINQINAKVAL
jgi:Fe-S cluster assembly scaffold protein SufB